MPKSTKFVSLEQHRDSIAVAGKTSNTPNAGRGSGSTRSCCVRAGFTRAVGERRPISAGWRPKASVIRRNRSPSRSMGTQWEEATRTVKTLEEDMAQALEGWSLEPVVRALMALRGVERVVAMTSWQSWAKSRVSARRRS